MTREKSLLLMHENVENENLRKHMYAVEAAMRSYAKHYNEDEELWGITGLVHDLDYEKFPSENEHSIVGAKILEENEFPVEIIHAIRSHVPNSETPRDVLMDKVLFSVDELCGFIVAVALVRPSKKIEEVKIDRAELLSNDELLEKFARENYLMKKPEEDLYVIVESE